MAEATTPAGPDPQREIVKWILEGQSEADIIDAIATTWPKQKAKPLIAAAIKEIAKSGETDPNIVRGFAIEGTREIYRKALEVGDHQVALRALKQLTELTS